MKNRYKRNVEPTLSIRLLNFFVCHVLITLRHQSSCHLFISDMLYSAPLAPFLTELVNVSLRFHTHVHVVVFGHQFCGFVYLNVYYWKLKNSILLIEFGEACCRVERA